MEGKYQYVIERYIAKGSYGKAYLCRILPVVAGAEHGALLQSGDDPDPVGKVAAVRDIGSGYTPRMGEQVVVKIISLPPQGGNIDHFIRATVNEVTAFTACGSRNYPSIVPYYESFQLPDGDLVIVMRYCNGGELQEVIAQRSRYRDRVRAYRRKLEQHGVDFASPHYHAFVAADTDRPLIRNTIGLPEDPFADPSSLYHATEDPHELPAPRYYFPEPTVLRLLVQLLVGLAFIHAHNVIHRDIKASNVFLHWDSVPSQAVRGSAGEVGGVVGDPGPSEEEQKTSSSWVEVGVREDTDGSDTQRAVAATSSGHTSPDAHADSTAARVGSTHPSTMPQLLVGDFGVAKLLEHTRALAATQIGTPYNLAPEVCRKSAYSNKADMWSLGVVFYELCALRRPFEAKNIFELFQRVRRCKLHPLPQYYSPLITDIACVLLARNPQDRPSAVQLLSDPRLFPLCREMLADEHFYALFPSGRPRDYRVPPHLTTDKTGRSVKAGGGSSSICTPAVREFEAPMFSKDTGGVDQAQTVASPSQHPPAFALRSDQHRPTGTPSHPPAHQLLHRSPPCSPLPLADPPPPSSPSTRPRTQPPIPSRAACVLAPCTPSPVPVSQVRSAAHAPSGGSWRAALHHRSNAPPPSVPVDIASPHTRLRPSDPPHRPRPVPGPHAHGTHTPSTPSPASTPAYSPTLAFQLSSAHAMDQHAPTRAPWPHLVPAPAASPHPTTALAPATPPSRVPTMSSPPHVASTPLGLRSAVPFAVLSPQPHTGAETRTPRLTPAERIRQLAPPLGVGVGRVVAGDTVQSAHSHAVAAAVRGCTTEAPAVPHDRAAPVPDASAGQEVLTCDLLDFTFTLHSPSHGTASDGAALPIENVPAPVASPDVGGAAATSRQTVTPHAVALSAPRSARGSRSDTEPRRASPAPAVALPLLQLVGSHGPAAHGTPLALDPSRRATGLTPVDAGHVLGYNAHTGAHGTVPFDTVGSLATHSTAPATPVYIHSHPPPHPYPHPLLHPHPHAYLSTHSSPSMAPHTPHAHTPHASVTGTLPLVTPHARITDSAPSTTATTATTAATATAMSAEAEVSARAMATRIPRSAAVVCSPTRSDYTSFTEALASCATQHAGRVPPGACDAHSFRAPHATGDDTEEEPTPGPPPRPLPYPHTRQCTPPPPPSSMHTPPSAQAAHSTSPLAIEGTTHRISGLPSRAAELHVALVGAEDPFTAVAIENARVRNLLAEREQASAASGSHTEVSCHAHTCNGDVSARSKVVAGGVDDVSRAGCEIPEQASVSGLRLHVEGLEEAYTGSPACPRACTPLPVNVRLSDVNLSTIAASSHAAISLLQEGMRNSTTVDTATDARSANVAVARRHTYMLKQRHQRLRQRAESVAHTPLHNNDADTLSLATHMVASPRSPALLTPSLAVRVPRYSSPLSSPADSPSVQPLLAHNGAEETIPDGTSAATGAWMHAASAQLAGALAQCFVDAPGHVHSPSCTLPETPQDTIKSGGVTVSSPSMSPTPTNVSSAHSPVSATSSNASHCQSDCGNTFRLPLGGDPATQVSTSIVAKVAATNINTPHRPPGSDNTPDAEWVRRGVGNNDVTSTFTPEMSTATDATHVRRHTRSRPPPPTLPLPPIPPRRA